MPEDKQSELPDNFKKTLSYINKELLGFENISRSERGKLILDSPLNAQEVYEKTVVPAFKPKALVKKQEKGGFLKRLFNRKKDTRDDDQKIFDAVDNMDEAKLRKFIEKQYDVNDIKIQRDNGLLQGAIDRDGIEDFVKNRLSGQIAQEVAQKKENTPEDVGIRLEERMKAHKQDRKKFKKSLKPDNFLEPVEEEKGRLSI